MSDYVDTRVVELDFQNKNFEKSAQESIRTLGNLENALRLDGSTAGLERVEKAARDMDLSVLERSVEKVSDKFSALGIMGVTAIQNITNKAINAGENLIRSLSFDQIMSGYSKMDQLTTATQTLRANGYEMERIEKELDKLMFFSDETSYSFNDMTSNLAKFTSQGLELEQSATALRGVAAWAAAAGQNSQTASRAMYNISQALGAGAMKVADWKSIELANMATSQFKELTLEAAAAVGTLTKENGKYYLQEEKEVKVTKRDKKGKIVRDAAGQAVKEVQKETKKTEVTIANFRETLKDGWFDNDTMMAVFKRYGAYSDLVQQIKDTFDLDSANQSMSLIEELSKVQPVDGKSITDLRAQILLSRGYVETLAEAKELLQGLDFSAAYDDVSRKAYQAAQEAKTFNEAIDATKDAVSSGWMRTFKYIFGNYEQQKTLWTDVANRLWDIFAEGGDKRNSLLKKWAKTGTDTVAGMITDLLDIVYNFKTLVSDAFAAVFGEITADDLISFTDRVAGAIRSLKEFSEDADRTAKISSVLQGIARALKIVADIGGAVIKFAGNFISAFGGTFLEIALDIADFLFAPNALAEGAKNGLVEALDYTSKAIVSFADKVRTVWRNIRDFLRYLFDPSAAFSDSEKAGKQGDTEGYQRIKAVYGTVEKIRSVWDAVVKPLRDTADKIQYVWSLIRYVIDPKAGKNELKAAANSGDMGLLDRIIAAKQTARDIRSVLQSLWSNLSSAFNSAKDFVAGGLSAFGFDVSEVWTNVTSWLGRFFAGGEETEKAVSELADKIKGTWKSIKQKIIDFASGFGIDIPSIAEAVSGFFKSLFGVHDDPKSISKLVKEKGGILIASASMSDGGGMLRKAGSAFEKGKKFGEKVKAAFEKISTFITNTWTAVSGFVSKAWNAVKPHIENAIMMVRFLFNPSSIYNFNKIDDDAMADRISNLYAIAMRIRDLWTRIVSAVTSIVGSIKAFVAEHDILGKAGRMKEAFVKLFHDVTEFISGFFSAFDVSLPDVWNKLISGDFSGAIQKIMEGLNNVSKWVSGKVMGLFVAEEGADPKKTPLALAIAWVQNAANTIFNAIKNTKLSNIFNSIVSYLKNTIVPLFLLISGGMLMYGIGKAAANSKKGAGIGEIMQQIAGAMLVLSASFAILGAVDEKSIETGKKLLFTFIGVVAIIKLLFFGINWLNKKFGKDKNGIDAVAGVGNEMLQIAGALAIIAVSIAGLSFLFKNNLLDLGSIGYGVAFIVGAGVLILGLVLALTAIQKKIKSKNESDSFDGLGDTVLKLAGAIGIFAALAVAVGALARLSPDTLKYGILLVGGMGVLLTGVVALLAVIQTKFAKGDDIGKFGNLMLKLAGAIAIMAVVVIALGTMSDVGWNGILHVLAMLAIAVGSLFAVNRILLKNKLDKSAWINLASLVVVVGSAVVAFRLIPTNISWPQIVAVLGGLAVACGSLWAVSFIIKKLGIGWGKFFKTAVPTLLTLVGMMAIVVIALNKLPKGVNLNDIEVFAAGMLVAIGALVALSAVIAVLGYIDPLIIGLGVLSLALVVAGIVGIVVLLGELEGEGNEISKRVEKCKGIAEKFGELFETVLQPLFDVITKMSSFITGLGTTLSTFIHNVTGFGVSEEDWKEFTSKDLRIASQATAIGERLNGIYTSLILIGNSVDADKSKELVDGFITKIESLGASLSTYIKTVTGFGVPGEDWEAFDSTDLAIASQATRIGQRLAGIFEAISGIAIYENADPVTEATNAIAKFSKDIETLGASLNAYVNSVTSFGMTNEEFEKFAGTKVNIADQVTEIGKKLADISAAVAGIPIYESADPVTEASNTIAKFSKDIETLGASLNAYVNTVTSFGMTNEEFEKFAGTKVNIADQVTEIGKKLADISKAVSGITIYNNVNQVSTASGTIAKFSKDIETLGASLNAYVNTVTSFGMTNDEFEKFAVTKVNIADQATEIGKKLADISKAVSGITIYNNVNQVSTASGTIAKFSKDIETLGTSLSAYIKTVTGFGVEGETWTAFTKDELQITEQATTIAEKLAGINEQLSKIDGTNGPMAILLGHKKSLSEFGAELPDFGDSLSGYVQSLATATDVVGKDGESIDLSKVEKMTNIAISFADFIGKLPKEGGLAQAIFGGSQWKELATSNKGEFESFGMVLGEAVSAFSLHLSDFADPKNAENAKIASDIVATFASAISLMGQAKDPTNALQSFMANFSVMSFEAFDTEKAKLAAEFIGGMGDIMQAITGTAEDENLGQRMADVGRDILLGLLEGLSDKSIIDALIEQMQAIADNLEFTVRVATETRSPSKLYERIGGYLMDGFALGIRNKADEPAKEMSNAVNGITPNLPALSGANGKPKSVSDFVKEAGGILIASAGASDVGGAGGLDAADVIANAVGGVIDSGIEKITETGKKITSGLSTAIEFLSGGSDSLIDSIAGVFGSSGDLSLDKLVDKLKGVLPEEISGLVSDEALKNLIGAVSGSGSALDKSFISGWLKSILDELTSMDDSQKSVAKDLDASQKASSTDSASDLGLKHTGNHKWSSTPTKEWQLRYATYAEQKKHGYPTDNAWKSTPQVVHTYRADGTLAGTAVEDYRGAVYHQRQDGSVYAVDKMGNSLVPVQDSADKARVAFEHLNDALNGTASASAEAASRAADQVKPGNQNETDKGVTDAVTKLNKDVTDGLDTMARELVNEVGDLGDSMRSLSIVLDDGTLVGKLLPAIDRGLGIMTAKKNRMNISPI